MAETSTGTTRVGIRELRQNLSVYVRRIHRGERFEVTERGRPVALLVPLADAMSPLARLVATGRARMPEGDLLDLPPLAGEPSTTASSAIAADREDRL
ncbi:MAG: type II toxin-antitoxin system prevent-host-death family antitoxin [Acidobacteria bacterium]|nr:type II toxin-antitoxin system prevent-host-death family antitoxin [Acidobacteriota bacterium]